jgi:RNA polymerase sigma-70 factor (ECF subfamily)
MNFEELAVENKDAVYRQMVRVCGNREDAEDVLIEALLKAYRNLEKLRDSSAFRAWLAQIARRVCWQLKGREALLPLMQLSEMEEEGRTIVSKEPPPEAQAAAKEMKQILADAMSELPEEHSGEEVARKLGISQAAMKSRLHRARESLRKKLDAALMRGTQEPRGGNYGSAGGTSGSGAV